MCLRIASTVVNLVSFHVTALGVAGSVIAQWKTVITCMDVQKEQVC